MTLTSEVPLFLSILDHTGRGLWAPNVMGAICKFDKTSDGPSRRQDNEPRRRKIVFNSTCLFADSVDVRAKM